MQTRVFILRLNHPEIFIIAKCDVVFFEISILNTSSIEIANLRFERSSTEHFQDFIDFQPRRGERITMPRRAMTRRAPHE